jgi:translocation and assembly module TamB
VRNAQPGPVDAGRLPVASVDARFATDGDRVALPAIDVDGPPGRLGGRATLRVPAGGGVPREFDATLSTERLDLRRAMTTLRATALRGSVRVRPRPDGLAFDAALADGEVALDARATWIDQVVELERASLRARDGEASFSGRVGTAGPLRFDLAGRLARLDPARFADVPGGRLDGEWSASGTLRPAPDLRVAARLAEPSRWRGLPLAGTLAGRLRGERLDGVEVDLRLGSSRASARGALGAIGDRLALSIDAPRLRELDDRLRGSLEGGRRAARRAARPDGVARRVGQRAAVRRSLRRARCTGPALARPVGRAAGGAGAHGPGRARTGREGAAACRRSRPAAPAAPDGRRPPRRRPRRPIRSRPGSSSTRRASTIDASSA